MLKPGPNDQPADKSTDLFTGGLVSETGVNGFSGQATILFDKTSKKLSAIALFLTPLKDASNVDKSVAYKRLRENLLKKYGSPVERVGCDEEATECHLIFKPKVKA
jgi:hypothetical protein